MADKWACAGGVVFDQEGRIALVRQWSRGGRLRWTLPKGRRDPGESLRTAALREVREETGVRARITLYLGAFEGKRSLAHYFAMTVVRIDGEHDAETVELRFFAVARAMALVSAGRDRRVLERALAPRRAMAGRALAG